MPRWCGLLLSTVGGILLVMIQISPRELVSNMGKWIRALGLPQPAWLVSKNTDNIIRIIAVIAIVVGLILAFIVPVVWEKSSPVSRSQVEVVKEKSQQPKIISEERIFVNISPENLHKMFKSHMGIQGHELIKPYIGKWMMVNGDIENINNVLDADDSVSLMFKNQDTFVMFFNDKKTIDRLRVMQQGENITVSGRIARVDILGCALDDCELVPNENKIGRKQPI